MTLRSTIIVSLLVAIDQITKFFVSANLGLNEGLAVIKGAFHITRVHNTGVAFGLFKGFLPVFIFISLATIFLVILYADRFRRSYFYLRAALLFILGGTIGNLIDRIRLGYVVDFIDLRIWPVFNVADIAITIGGGLLIYQLLVGHRNTGTQEHRNSRRSTVHSRQIKKIC